ncbi:sigma factor-like helix-turn-helix DNA-binding protein [Ornithinibacillus sp. 179-J 7C1 HS]|uniref:sigma factor-like helix-turn-helix DNA-binding protein n=1 Tax=Ornithinibacillus sp. 179-J 7C1 HS TaxID=3142384 RepID=UPI0039A260C6
MGPSAKVEQLRKAETFEELVTKLNRYSHFLTKNKWDGEDIAQEAITKALKHYEGEEHLSPALLKKIAYHIWIDHLRKQENETLISQENLPEKVTDKTSEVCSDLVDTLMKLLTPKQLISYVLKEAFQYKITEIADLLHMSETGVKALLNRSRSKIKQTSKNHPNIYWTAENREIVYPILVKAIQLQDPAILIRIIPRLFNHSIVPNKFHSSPSNVLSLAA